MCRNTPAGINGLILAAGMSRRMGDFKPLMPLQGGTVIEKTVDSMLDAGIDRIVIVLGYRGEEVEKLLRLRYPDELILVKNPHYATSDMLESVKCGLKCMPECRAFFLLPGDMPVIKKSTFLKMIRVKNAGYPSILFPTVDGYRKHPPLIDSFFIPDILNYQGEGGLRQLWKQMKSGIFTIPVDDQGVCMDLDTRMDYESCMDYLYMHQEELKEERHVYVTY